MKLKSVFSSCAALLLAVGLTAMSAGASDFGFAIRMETLNGETSETETQPVGSAAADSAAEAAAVWANITMANDELVETGLVVREEELDEAACVGFLYPGGAARVISRGDAWTEVESGTVKGYVKTQYLIFGDAARETAQKYGRNGVEASWDDVNVYAQPSGDGEILGTVMAGDTFPVVNDNGHWIEVGLDDEGTQTAFVSEEDVTRVFLLDSAFDIDESKNLSARKAFLKAAETETEEGQEEEYYEESHSETYYDNSSSGSSSSSSNSYSSSSSNNNYVAPAPQPAPQPETQAPQPETQAPQPETQAPQPETQAPQPETQAPQPETQAPVEESVPEDVENVDGGSGDDEVYVEDGAYSDDEVYEDDALSDDIYVEDSN